MEKRPSKTTRQDQHVRPFPRRVQGIGSLPSPAGRGWPATGVFTSRRGPGEGSFARRDGHCGPCALWGEPFLRRFNVSPVLKQFVRTTCRQDAPTSPDGGNGRRTCRTRPAPSQGTLLLLTSKPQPRVFGAAPRSETQRPPSLEVLLPVFLR